VCTARLLGQRLLQPCADLTVRLVAEALKCACRLVELDELLSKHLASQARVSLGIFANLANRGLLIDADAELIVEKQTTVGEVCGGDDGASLIGDVDLGMKPRQVG